MSADDDNNPIADALDFKDYLQRNNLSEDIIKKLTKGGLNSLHILQSINFNHHDWDEIAREFGLTAFDKLKLKAMITPLQDKPADLDPDESNATLRIKRKLKKMELTLALIKSRNNDVDLDINDHTRTIKSAFVKFRAQLNEREIVLLKRLNDVGITKKDKLKETSKVLTSIFLQTKTRADTCTTAYAGGGTVNACDIPKRKKEILKMANVIDNISIISSSDPILTDNKINLTLNTDVVLKSITSFGSVTGGNIPVLMSLTDNNDATILVTWKLRDKQMCANNLLKKLRVGWVESKLDADGYNQNEFDEKNAKNKEFNLTNNDNNSVFINVKNKLMDYQFRLQHWNGKKWSARSNIQTISIKKLSDQFNPSLTGTNITVSNKCSIIMHTNHQETSYLSRIVNSGIHHWKFRIDKYSFGNQMIGIWNTKYQSLNKDTYLWDNVASEQLYGFGFHANDTDCHWAYTGSTRQEYGTFIKNGDIIEMILDLNYLSLSFKINNTHFGKACDVAKTSYRVGCTLYGDKSKFTLLSYKPT